MDSPQTAHPKNPAPVSTVDSSTPKGATQMEAPADLDAKAGDTMIEKPSSEAGDGDPAVNLSHQERVLLKETALKRALEGLELIRQEVVNANITASDTELDGLHSALKLIQHDSRQFEFLVGIAGDTGMGKTSLLNALVNPTADIAPSSQDGACTATVCCFHYEEIKDKKIRAAIQFKSKDTVNQELSSFFLEYKEFEERLPGREEDDDTIAQAERERFQEQLKLIASWSGLDASDIERWGSSGNSDEITKTCAQASIRFNQETPERPVRREISDTTSRDFLAKIKPYVGNVKRRQKHLEWPIIEKVDIYLQSDVLKGGITIVDLPGELDALEARSRVARTYYDKLDRLIIATPADRAADNRTAMDFVREDQIIDLEADGKLDQGGFCVATTKIDLLDWVKFAENEEYELDDMCPEFESLKEFESLSDELDDMDRKMLSLQESAPVSQMSPTNENEADAPTSPKLNEVITEHESLKNQISKQNALCFQACAASRAVATKRTIGNCFDRVRNKYRKAKRAITDLNIFPVSSHAYRDLITRRSAKNFLDQDSTGIPGLSQWIIQGSLSRREDHADGILIRCSMLYDSLDKWANHDWDIGLKLSHDRFYPLQQILKEFNVHLTSLSDLSAFSFLLGRLLLSNPLCTNDDHSKLFEKTHTSLGAWMLKLPANKKMIQTEVEDSYAERFHSHVASFERNAVGKELHWSTFAACIRRGGGAYKTSTKPRQTHFWAARLHGFFWGRFGQTWSESFNQALPNHLHKIRIRDLRKISDHIARILESDTLPFEFKDAIKRYQYILENLQGQFVAQMKVANAIYRRDISKVRVDSTLAINGLLNNAYKAAQGVKGRGKFKEQRRLMREGARDVLDEAFRELGQSLDKKLRTARLRLKNDVKSHGKAVCTELLKAETAIAEEICSPNSRKSASHPDIQHLKDCIQPYVQRWKDHWAVTKEKLPVLKIRRYSEEELHIAEEEEGELATRPRGRKEAPNKQKLVAGGDDSDGLWHQKPPSKPKAKVTPKKRGALADDDGSDSPLRQVKAARMGSVKRRGSKSSLGRGPQAAKGSNSCGQRANDFGQFDKERTAPSVVGRASSPKPVVQMLRPPASSDTVLDGEISVSRKETGHSV